MKPRLCGRCGAAESEANPFQKWRARCVPCHRDEMKQYRTRYNSSDKGRAAQQRYRAKAEVVPWGVRNPERQRELRRAWKARNPDSVRAHTNRRRARLVGAAGEHSERDWQRLRARHGGLCYYCRIRPGVTRDHVIPLSRGGTDFIGNILPACLSCNSAKHNKTISEWRMRQWRMGTAGDASPQNQPPLAAQAATHGERTAEPSRS